MSIDPADVDLMLRTADVPDVKSQIMEQGKTYKYPVRERS